MARKCVSWLVIVLVFTGTGCETSYNRELSTIRYSDVGSTYSAVHHFGQGETPTILLCGYGGETITYEVINIVTATIVKSSTEYVPKKNFYRWYPLHDLPSSGYVVRLKQHGSVVDTWKFSVSK